MRVQMPLVINPMSDPHPDLAIVKGNVPVSAVHPTTAELIVEVSDTSLDYDTTEKMSLYAAAGITDYWVVDVNARQLLIFRNPVPEPSASHGATYSTKKVCSESDTATPLALPTGVIKVADMLP